MTNKESGPTKQEGDYKALLIIALALVTAFIVNTIILANIRVIGDSMKPFLNHNDWVLANRLAYKNSEPKIGDIVIFKKKDLTDEIIIKRIMGTPNDTLEIINGILYINDQKIKDDYGKLNSDETFKKITVPKDCYFLMGDNRLESNDSRKWTNPFVKKDEIIGKVFFRYYKGFKIIRSH